MRWSLMLDTVTLDQLRTLIVVAEEGSFSAAARVLQRVQSAVSQAMSNMESQLGVRLFDRSTRVPSLTDQGRAVVVAAQRVWAEFDALRRLSADMATGVEAQVSLCVDALFPLPAFIELCRGFATAFPAVDLRVDTQTLSAVSARVLDGSATLGVVSPMGLASGLTRHALAPIRMVAVVSPRHPLAQRGPRIPIESFADCVQIVLSERSGAGDGVADQAVLSPRSWRVADLHTKHALLRAGLGWGNLPEHLVRDDVRTGHLVVIQPEAWGEAEHTLHLAAVHRPDTTLGPAHQWVLRELEQLCARDALQEPLPAPHTATGPTKTKARTKAASPKRKAGVRKGK